MEQIGRIEALTRYPVKSMAGQPLDQAQLGWHGLDGDRRFAFRRMAESGGFPWLTAGRLAELLLYTPVFRDGAAAPSHVRTPDGRELALRSDELSAEITGRHGAQLELMQLKQGIYDETPLSILTTGTVRGLERASGRALDARRFRANVVIRTAADGEFEEDAWVGRTLLFGDDAERPAASIAYLDRRCAMVNLDPDTAASDPSIMKAVVRDRDNCAGVYAMVAATGALAVGQPVYLR
jgi:uncharacterized protein